MTASIDKLSLRQKLFTDYSDLRGIPPASMTSDKYVEMRRLALDSLKTQHFAGNEELTVTGDKGIARVSMVIYR